MSIFFKGDTRGSQLYLRESTFPEGVNFSRGSQLFPRESSGYVFFDILRFCLKRRPGVKCSPRPVGFAAGKKLVKDLVNCANSESSLIHSFLLKDASNDVVGIGQLQNLTKGRNVSALCVQRLHCSRDDNGDSPPLPSDFVMQCSIGKSYTMEVDSRGD